MKSNLYNFFTELCQRYPSRIAFIERGKYRRRIWTYAEVHERVGQLGQFLDQQGFTRGDKVILCAPNSVWWAVIFLACMRRGITLVPLDVNSSPDFIERIVSLTNARGFISSRAVPTVGAVHAPVLLIEDLPGALADIPLMRAGEDEPPRLTEELEIVFSSGSTGEPKGVVLTHENVYSNMRELVELAAALPRRFLSIVPLSHMLEQTGGLFLPLALGATVVYNYSNRPRVLVRASLEERVTSIVCVPAFLQLLRPTKDLGRLKEFYVGGAPLDPALEQFWLSRNVVVYQGYGLTEASPLISTNSLNFHRPQSVGKVLPGVSVRLAEDKEILVQGPNISSGYYKNPEATTQAFKDGWFATGDIGEIDDDGFLFIRGRKKNMIVGPSGMKIYPEDIEKVLLGQELVKDAVVCGIGDNSSDMRITAVVLAEQKLDLGELAARVNTQLASHQQVQEIVIWPSSDFPRTPTKKVIRKDVCEYLSEADRDLEPVNAPPAQSADPVLAIVAAVAAVATDKVQESSNLVSDLHMDSIKRLQLISQLEDDLGAELDDSQIDHTSTVSDIRRLVLKTAANRKRILIPYWQGSVVVRWIRSLLQILISIFLRLFQRLSISGEPPRLKVGPVIYVANHASHLDTPTVIRALSSSGSRRVAVAAAKDYFFKGGGRRFFSQLVFNAFPLDRDGNLPESLTLIGRMLDKGNSVLIYPEGTRSQTGAIKPFKNGIGVIATEMGVPVIPVKISGNFGILPKGSIVPKRGSVTVRFGGALRLEAKASYISITKALEETIQNL
ncbi:MAG: hypothetical protein COU11_02670 [Candidatus Harrisonbacteria bacterium CG10_big_fil_rev_8_21_14_0_10_49_15]|uniref:Carrier domain-containing protein n=1 Tax=Candidatus Harrisonbacteria bacterium CG10_big_fil_rev_8_21_14_0_10_49_15 TaxID=1974587 RepID=A0A2H0UN62_9BACT|nr:MAG: hypothetical protein COU11_02670 [Candidatus Harrisonbacteria bacterium CG10_big_fil_rev_8_21_14_0_10_49_15]